MIIDNTLAIASQIYYNIITFCNYIVLFVGGSVQMKKLPPLNLEVIRFTTEDVIVTSGTGVTSGVVSGSGHQSFIENHGYFTTREYLIRSGAEKPGIYPYFWFISRSNGEDLVYDIYHQETRLRNIDESYYYTWFVDKWYTDNVPLSEWSSQTN